MDDSWSVKQKVDHNGYFHGPFDLVMDPNMSVTNDPHTS